jgi:hypothetical protein
MLANRQRGIAYLLGVEAAHIKPPEQIIRRIESKRFGIARRRHLVSRRRHDQLVQRLELPVVINKPQRKPVQEFGMRRRRPEFAKIVGRADQSSSEMVLPDAIHDDTRSEHIVRRRNPLRQYAAAAGAAGIWRGLGNLRGHIAKQHREMRRHLLAGRLRIAPFSNVHRLGPRFATSHRQGGRSLGQLSDLPLHLMKSIADRSVRLPFAHIEELFEFLIEQLFAVGPSLRC